MIFQTKTDTAEGRLWVPNSPLKPATDPESVKEILLKDGVFRVPGVPAPLNGQEYEHSTHGETLNVACSEGVTPCSSGPVMLPALFSLGSGATTPAEPLIEPGSDFFLLEREADITPGIYFQPEDSRGEPTLPIWVCSPLKVIARTRNPASEDWGYLLEWGDQDRILHHWAMPAEMLSGTGEEYRRILLSGGLEIASGAKIRNMLTMYIQTCRTDTKVVCTGRTGWHDAQFVLPEQTIGTGTGKFLYQSTAPKNSTYAVKGTLDEWRDKISRLCVDNSRLVFSVSLGFASVLLKLDGDENGGFHFQGSSSEGKSTALKVAASLFGGSQYVQQWRATDNGLESIATLHNDTLLILDELGQVDPRVAGEIAYMLGNGSGKQRANRSGGTRKKHTWRALYLSSGEIDLAQHLRDGRKTIRAGQEVRLLTIPANAGAGLGIFETLHGTESGAVFSRLLQRRVNQYHGTASIAFIECVAENFDQRPQMIRTLRAEFIEESALNNASGQVFRAAERFALVAIAGELASRWDITGWQPGEATAAVRKCFGDWISRRGGVSHQEETQIIAQVKQFLENHGESRYSTWDNKTHDTHNRVGVRKKENGTWRYYTFSESFKNEICQGLDYRTAAKLLGDRGMLERDSEGKN